MGADAGGLGILPEQERSQILLEFNGKRGYFPPDALVNETHRRAGTEDAGRRSRQCGEHTLTYWELKQSRRTGWRCSRKKAAARISSQRYRASGLSRAGQHSGNVFKSRSGAYVPIDAASDGTVHAMLSDSGASIVLTVSAVFAGSDEDTAAS
ncbi:hypothetical protein P7H16_13110 [Paenibacillus larvae]|nr:hypothetical protein [Paenibacillus larvae]MDT2247672.1 hypothetical protein [Paenibacillus larvae]